MRDRKIQIAMLLMVLVLVMTACSSKYMKKFYFEDKRYYLDKSYQESSKMRYVKEENDSMKIPEYLYIEEEMGDYKIWYKDNLYVVSGTYKNYTVKYPDGSSSHVTEYESYWDDSNSNYPEDQAFRVFLRQKSSAESSPSSGIVGFLLILSGAFASLLPKVSWYFSRGWSFNNAEPGELYLEATRIGGIVLLIVGIFTVMVSCSS